MNLISQKYHSKKRNKHYYSTNIQCKDSFIVMYFINEEPLNYITLFASADTLINDIDCNYKFESNELERGDKLYFRLNIKKYSGSKMKIRLIFEKRFVNSIFIVDVCFFNFYPDEDEILIFSRDWKENLKENNIDDPDNVIIDILLTQIRMMNFWLFKLYRNFMLKILD